MDSSSGSGREKPRAVLTLPENLRIAPDRKPEEEQAFGDVDAETGCDPGTNGVGFRIRTAFVDFLDPMEEPQWSEISNWTAPWRPPRPGQPQVLEGPRVLGSRGSEAQGYRRGGSTPGSSARATARGRRIAIVVVAFAVR